ncbi:CoA pyrophosphatase [Actibacterium sp. XHP0104]|uniref:CoA pyrophosphatase n=1 Tax=Actibacterium sp. XHP0104 TaxID=2984335 RepID=UPI0021E7C180|nr:CoA pyrophosphatase [Actibacterium sp. XHP0104]MCV2882081.1 CoA pyrophosphatase [Actibacterium sp. XHP0104]
MPGDGSSDFDLNPQYAPPPGRVLRPASVLVGVTTYHDRPRVLLTKRSSRLKHHPGQIAFPGGKQDDIDAGPVEAALREAREEVGLPSENVTILGTLPSHETVTSFTVTPVFGLIHQEFRPIPEAGEVDEVFTVPLAHVIDPAQFVVQSRMWLGQRRYYYTVPFGPYYIWGATARILRGLAARMAD